MQLTAEQKSIVETEAPILVVRAFAGAGKTSTLLEFAKTRKHKKMLYLVLNKSVQIEAEQKFKGTWVKPITAHALAFRHVGHRYKHKLIAGLKPHEVEKALQLADELSHELGYSGSHNDGLLIASVVLASLNKSPTWSCRKSTSMKTTNGSKKYSMAWGGWTKTPSSN
ncbi:MAG: hypothetical protein Q7U38_19560 [Methylobacter sp.]|nr:hypothetical protein [Methylobacter sp.]